MLNFDLTISILEIMLCFISFSFDFTLYLRACDLYQSQYVIDSYITIKTESNYLQTFYHRHNCDNGYNVTENLADLHVRCLQVVLIPKMLTEITL